MKNEQLDAYIDSLEAGLTKLTPQEREDEIREIRQHLESLISRYMQDGKSMDEALALARSQFGSPESVGQELAEARTKESPRQMRKYVSLMLLIWAIQFSIVFLIYSSMNDKPTDFPYLFKDKFTLSAVLALPVAVLFWRKLHLKRIRAK